MRISSNYIFKNILIIILLSSISCNSNSSRVEILKKLNNIGVLTDTIPFLFENNDIFSPLARKIILKTSINEYEFYSCIDNGAPYTFLRIDLYHKLVVDPKKYENSTKILSLKSVNLNIKLNNFSLPVKTIALMNESVLNPKNSQHDILANIGLDLFENYIIKFDFIKKNMVIFNKLSDEVRGYESLNVFKDSTHVEKFRNLRRIKMNGFKLQNGENVSGIFLIDLGAFATIISSNSPIFKEMNIKSTVTDETSWAAKLISFTELHKGVDVNRSDPKRFEEMGIDGIIGMDFFSQFDLIFDYQNNLIYLKKNK